MEAWIPITIFAAFFQNLRSALQKHLKGRLSDTAAGYVRFVYALPFVSLYLFVLHYIFELSWPSPTPKFFVLCLLGGICQIVFTVLLLWMFSFRSFAAGTTFSKLEVVTVAILGSVLLGDRLNLYAWTAILISALGLICLSLGQSRITISNLISGITEKATIIGLACAAFLGGSVVFFRGASLSLEHDTLLMSATFTLAVSLVMQTAMMTLWLVIREAEELPKVACNWRWCCPVGIAASLASMGWFIAFTMQNAGHVRALGQIELLFTFIATTVIFREKVAALEYAGTALIAIGILLIILKG
ncbi:MAG: EamA family transporter [Gammaproteobacteria bacterium]